MAAGSVMLVSIDKKGFIKPQIKIAFKEGEIRPHALFAARTEARKDYSLILPI